MKLLLHCFPFSSFSHFYNFPFFPSSAGYPPKVLDISSSTSLIGMVIAWWSPTLCPSPRSEWRLMDTRFLSPPRKTQEVLMTPSTGTKLFRSDRDFWMSVWMVVVRMWVYLYSLPNCHLSIIYGKLLLLLLLLLLLELLLLLLLLLFSRFLRLPLFFTTNESYPVCIKFQSLLFSSRYPPSSSSSLLFPLPLLSSS